MKKKYTVIYINHDSGKGGAAYSLNNLLASVLDDVYPIVLLREYGPLVNQLKKMGIEVYVCPFELNIANKNIVFRYATYPLRLLRDYYVNTVCIRKMKKTLNGRKVDIIHTNSSVITIGIQMAREFDAKHVWHIRELMDLGLNMTPIEGFEKYQKELFSADALIAISKHIYEHRRMYLHKNAHIIPDAVRPISEICYDSNKEKYILFCAAGLNDSKGADEACEIFCRSRLYEKGYQLYYIGNYKMEYKEKLENIAASYNQHNSLKFLGYQNDIKKYMVKASAFLMCSKYEGLGRVTIEAMFYGCPVLGRNSGGTKDIIEDGRNGMLYDKIEDTSVLLCKLVEDKHQSEIIIMGASKDARDKYSEEAYGEKIISLYCETLKK